MNERVAFEREMRSLQVFEQQAPARPLPEHAGPKPCRGKSPKPAPDKPAVDITGRYYTARPSQSVVINQAGVHFEAVVSLPKRLNVSRNRGYNVRAADKELHREMKVLQGDLVKPDEFRWFNRDKASDTGVIRREGGQLYLIADEGSHAKEKIALLAMEKRPTLMGTVPTLRRTNWEMNRVELNELQPLLPWQKQQIEHILDQKALDAIFKAYFIDQVKKPDPVGVLINRLSERSTPQSPNYAPSTKFDQFPNTDLALVREYARRVLTAQRWTNARNVTRSHIDWIQAMLDQEAGRNAGPDEVFTRQLGLQPKPRNTGSDHQYEFTINLTGASLVLGAFVGTVTVRKLNGRKWGPKDYDIDLMGLNVALSGFDIKVGEPWKGYAESYLEWSENDIYGGARFFGAKATAGLDVAKARAGFMHVLGDEKMPPLEVLFWDAKLGVPNPDKVAEKWLKNVLQGEQKDKVTDQIKKKGVPTPKDLLKPSVSAAVLFGDITPSGSVLEKMRKLQKFDPIDLTRKLPGPEALGADVQSSAHFCLDDDQPTPAAVQALRALCARQLAVFGSKNASLRVLGHADTLGHRIPGHNQSLSERRAINTVAAVQGILGPRFKIERVEKKGLGDTLAGIESKGRVVAAPEHRRVDIYLNGSLELSLF